MATVVVGVDFGSTGLRLAYAYPGMPPVVIADPVSERWPWLLWDADGAGEPSLDFPGLKGRITSPYPVAAGRRRGRPAALVTEALRNARQRVEAHTAQPVGTVVVSVPARYSSMERTALRDAAVAAGFGGVELVSDSVAAVAAHGVRPGSPRTVLVIGMGYSGFELGLVRVASGRYRVLGYEGGSVPSGAALDREILRGWLDALGQQGLLPDSGRWDEGTWLRLRGAAQRVKEQLGTHDQVIFPQPVPVPDAPTRQDVSVCFTRPGFEQMLRHHLPPGLEHIRRLLEEAGMTVGDLDTVLLVGGGTRLPAVAEMVAEVLHAEPVTAAPEDLARGAALLGAGLAPLLPSVWQDDGGEVEAAPAEPAEAQAPPPIAFVMAAPSPGAAQPTVQQEPPRAEPGEPDGEGKLERAKRLATAGEFDAARSLLGEVVSQAQALLAEIESRGWGPESPTDRALRRIARAKRLLKRGKYEDAVTASHSARTVAPDSPDVFEAMIEVHVEAARANPGFDQYPDVRRWLGCACSRDPRLRNVLADRIVQHADQLGDMGRGEEARATLDEGLSINPDHPAAPQLLEKLRRNKNE